MNHKRRRDDCDSTTPKTPRLPKRVFLLRHGESLGNRDSAAYTVIPDWKIPITELGEGQALEAGKTIKSIIGDEPVSVYCSPYLRTKQTLRQVMTSLVGNPLLVMKEDPRITEQQFGNFQQVADMTEYKKEREKFGRFYYRFPQGESGLDVYTRVSSFISSLFREWEKHRATPIEETNIIIVTHGLTLRLFLMRWYHFSVTEFEQSRNPCNAAMVVMTRPDLVPQPSAIRSESVPDMTSDETALSYSGNSTSFVVDDKTWEHMNLKDTVSARERLLSEIKRICPDATENCASRESISPDNFSYCQLSPPILSSESRDSMQHQSVVLADLLTDCDRVADLQPSIVLPLRLADCDPSIDDNDCSSEGGGGEEGGSDCAVSPSVSEPECYQLVRSESMGSQPRMASSTSARLSMAVLFNESQPKAATMNQTCGFGI